MSDINIGAITEALNDKMDRDGNNIQSPRLPVFLVAKQDPSSSNNYTWYRKYSDGYVEQGGLFSNTSSSYATWTVNLPIKMSSTYYNAIAICFMTGGNYTPQINSRTATTVVFNQMLSSTAKGSCWEVRGMAA